VNQFGEDFVCKSQACVIDDSLLMYLNLFG
jgi:hypothetical protein